MARDAAVGDARAVGEAVAEGEAVNLKAPRMGGPLELLRGLEIALRAGAPVYLGGMFELGVGRAQARQLAALYCGGGPNDLAAVALAAEAGPADVRATGIRAQTSPTTIALDAPGFGGLADRDG